MLDFLSGKRIIIFSTIVLIIITIVTIRSVNRVEKLGFQLLQMDTIEDWRSNRNSPIDGFVNIGSELYGNLKSIQQLPKNSIKVNAQLCDCYDGPAGPDLVTHSIIIQSKTKEVCIRLHYDLFLDKYHIVGYLNKK